MMLHNFFLSHWMNFVTLMGRCHKTLKKKVESKKKCTGSFLTSLAINIKLGLVQGFVPAPWKLEFHYPFYECCPTEIFTP